MSGVLLLLLQMGALLQKRLELLLLKSYSYHCKNLQRTFHGATADCLLK